jgi:hypothetical protein
MISLVTLVLSVHGRDTIWLVVDRRLSYGAGRPPVDNAVKLLSLDTMDGVGLLAYAGLGATSRGTEPSAWMSNVLRGRGGLTFEATLGVLATVASRELPRHLRLMPVGAHFIVAPAFISKVGAQLFGVEVIEDRRTGHRAFRYMTHGLTAEGHRIRPRIALAGTGGMYLGQRYSEWRRVLLSLVAAEHRGQVSEYTVADHLASLNYKAHQGVRDGTVGPSCIVAWRRRRDIRRSVSGGAHQFYVGTTREQGTIPIPSIGNGIDGAAIATAFMAEFMRAANRLTDQEEIFDEMMSKGNERALQLPSEPDDKLR